MAMYYPQKTTVDMGPTAILPGSQYLTVNHETDLHHQFEIGEDRLSFDTFSHLQNGDDDDAKTDLLNKQAAESLDPTLQQRFITVEGGTVALIHYDLCHRGSRVQGAEDTRFMFKFQFYRVNEPKPRSLPSISIARPTHMKVVHEETLRWLGSTLAEEPTTSSVDNLPQLDRDLQNDAEAVRVEAAYALGRAARDAANANDKQFALGSLAKSLVHRQEERRRAAAFGLSVVGADAAPLLLDVLQSSLKSPAEAKKYAIWALGELGSVSSEIVGSLSSVLAMSDPSYEATLERATAAWALGLIGQHAYACGDQQAFSSVFEQLLKTAEQNHNYYGEDYRSLMCEEVTLSLLLNCAAAPQWALTHRGLLPLLARLVHDEDRYVMGYAAEALLTLLGAGSEKAQEALSTALARPGTSHADWTRLVQQRTCPRTTSFSPY